MNIKRHVLQRLLLLLPLTFASLVVADDAEIYYSQAVSANPNILFVLDNSGSMQANEVPNSGGKTRMQVMQEAFASVMDNAPANLNIGLMRYGGSTQNSASGVSFPVKPVDLATDGTGDAKTIIADRISPALDNLPDPADHQPVRTFLKDVSTGWQAKGYTPIVDALHEAALYYRGEEVKWGKLQADHVRAAHPSTYAGSLIYNPEGGCGAPSACLRELCGSRLIPDSCVTKQVPQCNWGQTSPTGRCCEHVETAHNEAGQATAWACKDNNYNCPTFGCVGGYADVDKEVCQQQICTGAVVGEAKYVSPTQYACQSNYIVLMSDGRPEYSGGTGVLPPSATSIEALVGDTCAESPSGYKSGSCGPELTKFLAGKDQNAALAGDQFINTFTVAFGVDDVAATEYLASLANTANGAFTAGNLQELTDAFTNILDRIDASTSSFSSPAYNVDKDSMLAHSDEVYIPVFERNMLPLWSGNLKKFKLKDGVIVGQDDQPAVDDQGVFTNAAWDLWSASASGKNVAAGGAASQLPAPALRKLYTDTSGLVLSELDVHNATLTIDDLYEDHDGNNGHGDNPGGCDPDSPTAGSEASCVSYRSDLINFVRGVGKDGQPRQHMGDVMHNKPLVVDYTSNGYVLVGSNEGFLHAFDSGTGIEKWAFMPEMLLKNAAVYYDNTEAKQHVYGIDGAFTPWFRDKNANGKVDTADGDKFYLYFGMRRGGRAYYALDISDIDSPKVLWKITSADTGFAELGESWSKPAMAKMRLQPDPNLPAELKDVLVFGGGFDPVLEESDPVIRSGMARTMGRDVFIVDAETGALVWSLRQNVTGADASLTDSIPGDIRVLDMDRNGALDRLYFSDTGGKVWRVDMDMDVRDIDASLYEYADAKLTLFANLAGTGADSRKFYYEPDVALMQNNGQTVMTVSIGSGYRSHPQNTDIQDRFYVMRDENVYSPPADSWVPLEDADMTEADAMAANGNDLLDGTAKGWHIDLPNRGEKVLAPAVTFLNKVIFTTFANDDQSGADVCTTPPNSARAYVVNLLDGQAVADLDRSGDGVREKSVVAGVNEILSSAQILFRDPLKSDGTCKEADCGQTAEIRVGKMNVPVMDSGNSSNGANTAESTDLTNILPLVFWRDNKISMP